MIILSENKVSSPVIMEMKNAMKRKTNNGSYSENTESANHGLNEKADEVEKRESIIVDDLPATITSYILKNHKYFEIKKSYKITNSKNAITFEVHFKNKDDIEVIDIFDSNGKFLSSDT